MKATEFDEAWSIGTMVLQWSEPANDYGAVVLGYKVYADSGNGADTAALFIHQGTILDPAVLEYRRPGVSMGRSYKYRVTAVTETGEGAFTSGTFIAATVPMAPNKPIGTSFTESAVGIKWYFSHTITKRIFQF